MSNTTPTTSKVQIAALDFDTVKGSLRDFLRSQAIFKDFDFEGSGLAILLDVLAYNTHYFGFYLSMIGNEMFLDSANMRSSVVSLAKHLSYTPRSITSSKAVLSITITPNDGAAAAVIEKGTRFSSNVDGNTFQFVTNQAYGATIDSDGKFRFPNVTIIEGTNLIYRIVVDSTIPNQRFLLPNASVDTSTLTVRVQRSIVDSTLDTYTLATNMLELKNDTKAYFVQEVEDGKFEVYFGDGVIGQNLIDGQIVIIDYVVSKGSLSNGANFFSAAMPVAGYQAGITSITTLVSAAGGLVAETTDQIKFAAPKNYEAQGRAVTISDYKTVIAEDYTNLDSVAVWGGEDNVPPQYGKVFISIKPVKGYVVTETTKALVIQNIIRKRNIIAVIPDIIDPDYTFIVVNCKVKYNPANTTKTEGDITSGAYNAIVAFAANDLDKFDRELRYSRLLSSIDGSDVSITNNLTTIQMKKVFTPRLEVVENYEFVLNNAIAPGTLQSSSFITVHDIKLLVPFVDGKTYTIQDDALGNLQMIQHSIGLPDTIVRRCGTIDYALGHILIEQIIPFQADVNGAITVTMTPKENDVIPLRNNILFVQPEDITVVAIAVVPLQS
jgi:hypothetical protein